MRGRHAFRSLAALLLATQFLTGCSKEGSSGNPLLVYLPEFVLKHSDSAFDSLVKNPASLDARLRRGLSPNLSSSDLTPLIVRSVQLDAPQSFAILVRHRANLSHTDHTQHNAGYYALSHPNHEFVRALEEAGQPVVLEPASQLPDLVAELKEKQLLANRLPIMLRSGLDWDAASPSGAHALDYVMSPFNSSWFERMVGAGASPIKVQASVLAPYLASDKGPILEYLLRAGIYADAATPDGKSLLYLAVEQESTRGVELLLRYGASADVFKATQFDPQMLALLKGQTGIALELLSRGANPDTLRADRMSAVDAAELMLDHQYLNALKGVLPRSREVPENLLLGLRSRGYLRPSEGGSQWNVTTMGALMGLQSELGFPAHGHPSSALMAAVDAHLVHAKLLKAARLGDLNWIDSMRARYEGVLNKPDSDGWTALMHASYAGQAKVVQNLLLHGANADAADNNGSTALLLATLTRKADSARKIQTIRNLISARVKDIPNSKGLTARSVAQKLGPEMQSALRDVEVKYPEKIYVALMGRPGVRNQEFHCADYVSTLAWITQQYTKASRDVEALGAVDSQLCVVAGDVPGTEGRLETFRHVASLAELKPIADELQKEKQSLMDLTRIGDEFTALFATPRRSGHGWGVATDKQLNNSLAKDVGAHGWRITKIIGNGNGWIYLYGDEPGYGAQSYVYGSLSHVVQQATSGWKTGHHVTSLARNNNRWLAVLSEGSGLKDQAFVFAEDSATFRKRIDEKYKDGWRLSALLSEKVQ